MIHPFSILRCVWIGNWFLRFCSWHLDHHWNSRSWWTFNCSTRTKSYSGFIFHWLNRLRTNMFNTRLKVMCKLLEHTLNQQVEIFMSVGESILWVKALLSRSTWVSSGFSEGVTPTPIRTFNQHRVIGWIHFN